MPVMITESTSIDYDINGDGPPLVLISGLGFGRWGWFKQVPAFSRHFRTITFDIRGERRLEDGVDVLVCTSYGGRGPESMSAQALWDMLGWGSFSPEGVVRRGLKTATSEAYRAKHEEEFEQLVSWRLADSPSDASYYEQARAGAGFDLSRDVGRITSPTLVIHGAEDRYVPVANAAALARAIPGARLS